MQSGIAPMLISTEELNWQSELDHANRAFAAMIGGQRYENITREEAKRLCPPQLAHKENLAAAGFCMTRTWKPEVVTGHSEHGNDRSD